MGGGASKKQKAGGPDAAKPPVLTAKPPASRPPHEKHNATEVENFLPECSTPTPPGSPEKSPTKSSNSKMASKTSPKTPAPEAPAPEAPKKGAWGEAKATKKRPPELTAIDTPHSSVPGGMIDLPSPNSSEESFCVVDESTNKKISPRKSAKSATNRKNDKDFSEVLPVQKSRAEPGALLEIDVRISQMQTPKALPPQRGGATRITLFAGIMDSDRSTRYAALHELCELLKEEDDGSVEPEFNLTMVTEIMGLLMDRELEVRSKAAETAVNMAASESFPNITLEVLLERLYAMLQASQDTDEAADLCSGACVLVTRSLNTFFGPEAQKSKWGSDVANSRVHLQAAIWDMTALVQRGLNEELSKAAKESAIDLAVAVFLHLGVDESSNLLDGCSPSMVSFLFEKFADAEGQDAPISPNWPGVTPSVANKTTMASAQQAAEEVYNKRAQAKDLSITANEESLMDDILEEVGLAFDDVNERLVRDKIICNASNGRTFTQSKLKKGPHSLDDELAGLGLPDDLMQWTKTVLADDNELS